MEDYYQLYPVGEDEQARVAWYMHLFSNMRTRRVNFELQWEESASICWPEYRNTFAFGHVRAPGMKLTQYQVDSKGAIASHRFGAIVDSMMTPHNLLWSKIACSNKDLLRDRSVRLYFDLVTRILWRERYAPEANFIGQNQQNWQALGVFGNMGMRVSARMSPDGRKGLSYRGMGPGETYYLVNAQGLIDGYIRHFRIDARQAYQQFVQYGKCPEEKFPTALGAAMQQNSKVLFNFFEIVHPRKDWVPWETMTPRGKPWVSCYVSIEGYCILEEGGYATFPHAYGRYLVAPEEDYGRGPAQMVLPALKTKNAQKSVYLKQGHLAGDPAYLIGDDGLVDFRTAPGEFNYGGFDENGRRIVDVLPTGNIQITKEMMDEEGGFIDDAFLVALFQLLFADAAKGSAQKSAREVIEYASERSIFLAPTVGRQSTEYLAPMVHRELDVLGSLGMLPPMPPALREARGEYEFEYTSPASLAIESQKIAGAMRTIEWHADIVNKGAAPPETMDIYDWDELMPDIGRVAMMEERWFTSAQKRRQLTQVRQQAQEREARAKEAPAQAAIMKAQAIVAKAQTGGNIGGTLSGVPAEQMPQIPGQPPGLPGRPGIGGQPGMPGQPAP